MTSEQIIIIDDEDDVREAYTQTLQLEGFDVAAFAAARDALSAISVDWPGVVVTDLRMPRMGGMELLEKIHEIDSDIPVVMITAHGDVPVAVDAMRKGAYDFLEKPPDPLLMLEVVQRALKHRKLVLENRHLRQQLIDTGNPLDTIIGKTPVMTGLRQTITMLANADVDTLINGETGTGKELVARALHKCSKRAKRKFVALNCAALPESLIESELFGHEKGAFTNAHSRRIGKVEYAHKGVLFLDEIESMPLSIQAKLLRVLQERSFERVGANEVISVNICVIAAAKVNLRAMSEQGSFRSDLYYRLNVASIELPALRHRRDDIPLLFSTLTKQAAMERRTELPDISAQLLDTLIQHDWPGNVRELKNVAEKFVIGLPLGLGSIDEIEPSVSLNEMTESFEKQCIIGALVKNNGHIAETAAALGLPRKTLYLRMQKYNLQKETYRAEEEKDKNVLFSSLF